MSTVYGSPASESASVDHPDKISDRNAGVGPDAFLNPLSTAFDVKPPETIRLSSESARLWSGVVLNVLATTFDLELVAPSGLYRDGHAPGRRLAFNARAMAAPCASPSAGSFSDRPQSMP
ncbi:MAG: hypothetical protein IPO82_01055 [Betaproteobacteria bacterium]|nr:hypothetical protein [Betaproteobacteria bacterium]